MAVLGVLLGLTMAALVGVCLYGWGTVKQLKGAILTLESNDINFITRLDAHTYEIEALQRRDEQPKTLRPRTMGDVRRAAEAGVLPVERR